MDKLVDVLKELLDNGISKVLAILILTVLPILALVGNFDATGNYWLDLLIAFGITGTFVFLVWLTIKK